jgi:hypothetical protein
MPRHLSSCAVDLREDRRSKVAALLAAGVIRLVRSRIPEDATCLEFSGGSSLSVCDLPPFFEPSLVRKSVVVICPELPGGTQRILWGPGCPASCAVNDFCSPVARFQPWS